MNLLKSVSAVALAASVAIGALLSPSQAPAQANDQYLGQMILVPYNFCPRGWSAADGQLLSIAQNSALFSLLGTIYGGDGRTTFGLPDLRGRAPIHFGSGPGLQTRNLGERGGAQTHTMAVNEMPSHNHIVNSTNATADKHGPGTDFLAVPYYQDNTKLNIYHEGPPNRTMDPAMIQHTGGGAAFNIQSPYLAMRWCIATIGIFPSRN